MSVPLHQLPSRVPLHPRSAARRADPFWSGLFRTGSTGDWYSADDYRGLEAAEFATAPAWLRMSFDEARERVLAPKNREAVLRVVAALDQWRTMTVQQLEGMTDLADLTRGDCSLLSALWNAGLVEICDMGAPFRNGLRSREGLLLRPARPGRVLREFEESLSYAEWVSATAGTSFDADRQFARHNVLATELGLRVAEYGNVGMVLGEKLSSIALLGYSGVGVEVPSSGAANGSDLTLVRADGLRIAVEVTASVSGGWLYDKVERLVRILHRRPLAETGLCVLFVVAPRREAAAMDPREMLRKVKGDIQKAVTAYPGKATDPTAARIGVVGWPELFPDGKSVHRDFAKLPVERPTGPGYLGDPNAEGVWKRAHFLDPASVPFAPDDPAAMTAVFGNASGLRGVPHMLRRTEGRPRLADIPLRAFGFDEIPQVQGTKPVAQGRGAVGAAGLPPRLVY